MPDSLNTGLDYDDDGMQVPHLDMDSVDKNGKRHHDYKAYKAQEQRRQALEEAKEIIESAAPGAIQLDREEENRRMTRRYTEFHIEPVNRREQALQSDDADYLSSDEDLEDKENV